MHRFSFLPLKTDVQTSSLDLLRCWRSKNPGPITRNFLSQKAEASQGPIGSNRVLIVSRTENVLPHCIPLRSAALIMKGYELTKESLPDGDSILLCLTLKVLTPN